MRQVAGWCDAKRLVDVVGAGVVLLLTIPLQLLVAAVVRWDLGSPVLFRQWRPGLDGRPFLLVKFRTMRAVDETMGVVDDAARLTTVGRWLRASSLDELPTLWNILRGQMSLVGPRPLHMAYLDRYSVQQARRHEVRPGLTGLAQVSGRNAVPWERRLALDVAYVDGRCARLDSLILLRTVGQVLRRRGITDDEGVTMTEFLGTTAPAAAP